MSDHAAPAPPTAAALGVLRELVGSYRYPGNPTLSDLGTKLGVTKTAVRAHLLRLHGLGLVEQSPGKVAYWVPTPAGERAVAP